MPTFDACPQCGGTDYYNEAGFYYCSECQLQSQQVHEYEFDDEAPQQKTTKVLRKEKKQVEYVTSWECYNYVLLGLTNELMDLGAEDRFKRVVQALWFKYLKSIEVIRDDACEPPKLQAYNNKVDAEIVYKRRNPKPTKRKRHASTSSFSDGDTSTLSKRERGRLRQALMQAEYDAISTQQTDTSLHNASLGSLTNLSEDSKKQQHLQYAKHAQAELQKLMSPHHLTKHIEDINGELTCHKVKVTDFKNKYRFGPEVLNRSKLYIILYLALNISRESIQLGDLLRYMYEGHVSLNQFKHFFPEFLHEKMLNMNNLTKNQHVYSHHFLRKQTAKFAFYLQVEDLLVCPDLNDLARRYCKEMNLPDKICEHVITLISNTKPVLKIKKERYKFPNYEGRVVCLIIFVLKLFFGLDGFTEFAFSKLANSKDNSFDFKAWLDHICYRRLVISRHHFPTQFSHTKEIYNTDAYVEHMHEYFDGLELECDNNVEYVVLNDLLGRMNERFGVRKSGLKFEPSLTPFRDYTKVLVNANGYLRDVLVEDFKDASLDFSKIKGVEVIKGGANEAKVVPFFNFKNAHCAEKEKVFACTFMDDYQTPSMSSHKNLEVIIREGIDGGVLYRPEITYWMLSGGEFENMTQDFFVGYFKAFPSTFRIVVEECARVTGQSLKDIIEELNIVESYLCYVFDFKNCTVFDDSPEDPMIARFVNKFTKFW